MGKIKPSVERVVWTSETATKTCKGVFKQDVGVNFVLEELKNAPVEYSSLESRTNPRVYADEYLVIETALNLSEEDFEKIPFKFLETGKSEKTGYKTYKFLVEELSEQTL